MMIVAIVDKQSQVTHTMWEGRGGERNQHSPSTSLFPPVPTWEIKWKDGCIRDLVVFQAIGRTAPRPSGLTSLPLASAALTTTPTTAMGQTSLDWSVRPSTLLLESMNGTSCVLDPGNRSVGV